MKILIVDQSERVRSRLGERFIDHGFDVLHASATADALDVLSNAVVAIVFDLHIKSGDGESGVDALARLRGRAPKAMLVVLTNETHDLNRRECLRRGADFFFDKSSDFDRAVDAVLRWSMRERLA